MFRVSRFAPATHLRRHPPAASHGESRAAWSAWVPKLGIHCVCGLVWIVKDPPRVEAGGGLEG